MWSAVIKAVDGAAGRLQKGMSAGIDVANSQHGGAAPASGQVDASSENKDNSGNGKTGGVANIIKNVIDKVGVGGGKETSTDAGSILSDEEAKEAKSISAKTAATNTVSSWKKARDYGTNLSKGFANAGAVATGQGKQYDIESPSIVDFDKDITKDFKAYSTNIKKSK